MSDKRRAEIEAKRAKLADLRKARADRQRAENERRQAETATATTAARRDVDDLVSALVGSGDVTPLSTSLPGTPPRLPSRQIIDIPSPPVPDKIVAPDLVDVDQELFELPQRERVIYNKEVQTVSVAVETPDEPEEVDVEAHPQTLPEQESESEAELERESTQLDLEIEQEIRELTEEERTTILTAPDYIAFVEHSSKIVQRALSDPYDYTRDYTVGAEANGDDSEGKRVKRVCAFFDERHGKNRSITDLDWSPKYPELSVASYNKNPAALNEPDGIVAVWNLHLLDRPEFVFHSQSDVLSVTCSPFHPNLIFGGTYSGQILLWDTRAKHLPVLKTPLSAAGHTHPVYAMQIVGTQNAHNLITSSTDGTVCSWLVDMLAQPQETLELVHAGHSKTGEVAVTAMAFPDSETAAFWVGTEEGSVYQANRHDRAGAKAGLASGPQDVYRGHAGPVTALHFHPLMGPLDFSDLLLSASADWTVKLWRARSGVKPVSGTSVAVGSTVTGSGPGVGTSVGAGVGVGVGVGVGLGTGAGMGMGMGTGTVQGVAPLYSFDEADDYVYDAKWHPVHPAVFGTADGSGRFDLWQLNTDTEVPVVSTHVTQGRALNKLAWDRKDGRRVAMGGSDGRLYVYDIGDLALPRESEWVDMQKTLAAMAGSASGVGGTAATATTGTGAGAGVGGGPTNGG